MDKVSSLPCNVKGRTRCPTLFPFFYVFTHVVYNAIVCGRDMFVPYASLT